MSTTRRVVGIFAGGGSLPREIAESVVARGDAVHIVALAGAADADFSSFPVTPVRWGEIGAMVRTLKRAGCQQLVIVGSVRRPDLSTVRPDLGLLLNLPTIVRIIAAGGDDGVLTRVVRFFEEQGFTVVAPAALAPGLVVGEGPLGAERASAIETADVARGFEVVRALGAYDVGQAVVVAGGRIEAVEDAGGTDAMLARVAELRRSRGRLGATPSGVLVKRPKPRQELRVDLPAIGPDTVRRAAEAGLAGIAVLAGGTLAAEKAKLVSRADADGLFVQGFTDAGAAPDPRTASDWRAERAARRVMTAAQHADAIKGASLLTTLAPLAMSRAAVVDRGYVLAVESGEGAAAAITRAGGLRQWGGRRWSRRAGVVILSDPAELGQAIVSAAAAGLAGVAAIGQPSPEFQRAAADADRLGICLVALTPSAGTA